MNPGMDLPDAEPRPAHDSGRRRLVVVVVIALVALAVVGVTDAALAGHDSDRVVAAPAAAPRPPAPAAPASGTYITLWAAPRTTVAISTTAPWTTSPPTAARYVPPPPAPTTPPATHSPARPAPQPAPVLTAANLQIAPAQANFPSLPPPYWPMPIVAVTITNTTGVTVRSVVVHPVGVYSVPSSTCATLAPGQSCVAKVQFCPTSPNHYLDTLVVTGQDAATGSPVHASITLNGTAT